MIQNTFLQAIPNLVAGNSVTLASHVAFGSSATDPLISESSLAGEVGSRVGLDETTVENNTVTFVATRPSTAPGAGGQTLTTLGLVNSSSGGEMWASALLSSLLHTTSFDIETNQTVRFNRG